MSNTFEQAKENVCAKYPHLELIEYNGFFHKARFIDLEYGEFSGTYQCVYSGNKKHPTRVLVQKKERLFEAANSLLKSKFPYLELLEYNTRSKPAKVFDSKYGEFSGVFNNILLGKKKHHCRIQDERFENAQKNLRDKFPHYTLLQYNGVSSPAVVLDSEYGEFTAKYSRVIAGYDVHPDRKLKLDKDSLEEYKRKIKNNFPYLTLIELNDKDSVFLDDEYGEFKGNYYKVLIGSKKHPERSKNNKIAASKRGDIKEKRKKTCLKRYGSITPLLNETIKNKIRETIEDRYGVSHISKSKKIIDKINSTKVKRGISHSINNISAAESYRKSNLDVSYTHFLNVYNVIGDKALELSPKMTDIEFIIKLFLEELNQEFVFNKRLDGTTYRPDFRLENLIIETDGLKYHSDLFIKQKDYHQKKQMSYQMAGYNSLFFRSDEINYKLPIVKSIIKNKLRKLCCRIFARKCTIIEISPKQYKKWFDVNHLMGSGVGLTKALIFNDEIVSAMSVIKKKSSIEISRFSNKLDTIVVGGFTKLLNCFIREIKPDKIISFVDARYGTGHSLIQAGFVEESNHLSFKWTDFHNTYHRLKYPKNSGYEQNMFKIWDCGQKKFVRKGNL